MIKRFLILSTLVIFTNLSLLGCSGLSVKNKAISQPEIPNSNSLNEENQFYQPTVTTLMENYLKDHGYTVLTDSLAGAPIQLPNSFTAVINGVKIGEFLRQKNELSKHNNFDFSKYLGEKASIFTWGLDGQASSPNGSNAFFIIHNGQIVGVWFEPNTGDGQKNLTLSVLEKSLKS